MNRMFEYLDYIYAVYQEASFSRAAEKLYLSQSSLSLTIKKAEREIGAEIFNRKTKPLELTDFGKRYIAAGEKVLSMQTELGNYIYDSNHLKRGTLTVGSGNFLLTYYVSPVVAKFKEKYPNVEVNLVENRSLELERLLEKGSLDLVVSNAKFDSLQLFCQPLLTEQLLLVVPQIFVIASGLSRFSYTKEELIRKDFDARKAVPLELFKHIPFIGLRPGNDSRRRTDQILKENNIQLPYFMQMDQSSTAFITASNGSGSCIAADTVIRKLWTTQALYVFRIDSPAIFRDISVCTSSKKYHTSAMDVFIKMLQDNTTLI